MCNFCTYTVLVTAETRQKHIEEYFRATVENQVLIKEICYLKGINEKSSNFRFSKESSV